MRGAGAGSAAGAAGAGGAASGEATLNPLTMASVAEPVATDTCALVVTDRDTRYLSGPDVAMRWRREVFSVMLFCR